MLTVKDRFDEVFDIEIDGWCYGIQHYPGEIFPGLVHAIVKELTPSFGEAISHNVVFNILEISAKMSRAAKYLVHEKEICMSIVARLPAPHQLNEDGQFVLAQIVDQADQEYGGVLEDLQRKWSQQRQNQVRKAA